MRRKEKEVTDPVKIEKIINQAVVCRLGLLDGDVPYIVPLSFGYMDNTLYFHSALKGKKIDLILKHTEVCFEIDIHYEPIESEAACDWGMRFQSIIGTGKIEFIENLEEKRKALAVVMAQYSEKAYSFPDKKINATAVLKLKIDQMSAKQSGFPIDNSA